jgi:hypothetical protein
MLLCCVSAVADWGGFGQSSAGGFGGGGAFGQTAFDGSTFGAQPAVGFGSGGQVGQQQSAGGFGGFGATQERALGRPKTVYHGTSLDRSIKILQNGFDVGLSGTNAGAMLGKGLYVTTTLQKTLNYAAPKPCQGAIFELQVHLGRCYTVTSRDDSNMAKWKEMGYDSAWAAAGIIGEREENCIKDPRPPRATIQNVILGHTGEAKRAGYSCVCLLLQDL